MDPITMPAMAPPLRTLPWVPVSSAMTVVVAWRIVRILVRDSGRVLVGLSADAGGGGRDGAMAA